ncbi:unnamed protein product, partial [marine sediment metagenome]
FADSVTEPATEYPEDSISAVRQPADKTYDGGGDIGKIC